MKATDLMIGDYVYVKPSKMVIKVAAVHNKKVAYHSCISKLSWVGEGLLEAIPLTKDILIKNGFGSVIEGIYDDWEIETYSNQNLRISLSHVESEYNPTQLVVYMGYEPQERVVLRMMPCEYVHELQHAFRLCRIKKEIGL